MQEELITILSSGALATAFSSGITYLAKNLISERLKAAIKSEYDQKAAILQLQYEQKLETHKAQLKFETDKEIEQLKAKLAITAAERNIQYSKVFEHTAETIVTLHRLLGELHTTVETYIAVLAASEDGKENFVKIINKRNEFQKYFNQNRIYLPKNTGLKVNIFEKALNLLQLRYEYLQKQSETNFDSAWKPIEKLMSEIPKLLEDLEDEFQNLLGIKSNKEKIQ